MILPERENGVSVDHAQPTEEKRIRVIVSIQHPAHVHLFRNAIRELANTGHEIRVFVREKDIAVELLQQYNIPHTVLVGKADSFAELALVELIYEFRLSKAAREFRPDVMIAVTGVGISRPSTIAGAKCLVFTDTEHQRLQNALSFPFADRVCTPECYQKDIGSKQVRYPGYHELAYLHPNRFTPDKQILDEIGCSPDETLVILRLVSWGATHDIGHSGFTDVTDVVEQLESTGARVLITSESPLPSELEEKRVTVPAYRIHHLMYYADLFIGESATMATESAVLGTPAIFVSSSRRGYTDELEEEYGLVFNYSNTNRQRQGLKKALSILSDYRSETWSRRREKLLEDKIDTTEYIIRQILDLGSA